MLLKVETQNIKKIKYVEFENTGRDRVIVVSGGNAEGKSSWLDSIAMTIYPDGKLPENVLHEGETDGHTIVEVDDYEVKRRVWRNKTGGISHDLVVRDKTKDNAYVQKPSTFLKSRFGKQFYNPSDFSELTPGKRVDVLREALGVDFSELDAERLRLFNERTEVGREKKLVEGNLRAYTHLPDSAPETREVDAILAEIKQIEELYERERNEAELAERENRKYREVSEQVSRMVKEAGAREQNIAQMEADILRLQEKIKLEREKEEYEKQVLAEAEAEQKRLGENLTKGYAVPPEKKQEMNDLRKELKENSLAEKTAQEIKLRDKIEADFKRLGEKHLELHRKIDGVDKKKKKILSEVEWPIPGMSFGENDIEKDGVPFSACSTAEQVLMAISINARLQSDMRIIQVREGSFLDDSSMEKLKKIAEEHDYTILVEVVKRNDDNALLVMEEGRAEYGRA